MLEGLVQHDHPLTLQHVLGRMRRMYGDSEVATLTDDGLERASFAEVCERVDRLCRALESLGVGEGDRVATFAWNSQRHLEAYLAAPCMGAVLHTLNIRLFEDQLTYIANHAQDKVVTDFRAVKAPDKVKALHGKLIAEISDYGNAIDKAKLAFSDEDPQAIVKAQADLVSAVTHVQAQINTTIADINKKLRE